MYTDDKINYTNYLADKPQETNPTKLAAMKQTLVTALRTRDVHGHISAVYYTDGRVKVNVDGECYGVFNSNVGEFFSGYVGD